MDAADVFFLWMTIRSNILKYYYPIAWTTFCSAYSLSFSMLAIKEVVVERGGRASTNHMATATTHAVQRFSYLFPPRISHNSNKKVVMNLSPALPYQLTNNHLAPFRLQDTFSLKIQARRRSLSVKIRSRNRLNPWRNPLSKTGSTDPIPRPKHRTTFQFEAQFETQFPITCSNCALVKTLSLQEKFSCF